MHLISFSEERKHSVKKESILSHLRDRKHQKIRSALQIRWIHQWAKCARVNLNLSGWCLWALHKHCEPTIMKAGTILVRCNLSDHNGEQIDLCFPVIC